MRAYYNEFDPYAAAWLRSLISEGLVANGDVDERSIVDVRPADLTGYTQVHLFAGIGGWSYALRLANWPDDVPVWTGSCPCQPFSVAGQRKGTEDVRHLWPEMRRLIDAWKPAVVFGEQVASKAGRDWLSGVRADMETLAYEFGAADLCAAGVGAPHIRQRLWWVAESERDTGGSWWTAGESSESTGAARAGSSTESGRCSGAGGLADDDDERRVRLAPSRLHERWEAARGGEATQGNVDGARGNDALRRGDRGGMGDASSSGAGRDRGAVLGAETQSVGERIDAGNLSHSVVDAGADGGMGDAYSTRPQGRHERGNGPNERTPWETSLAYWIPCADGKARRLEPGIEPLADGVSARVGKLRAYGNAIVPQVAATFIAAYADVRFTR